MFKAYNEAHNLGLGGCPLFEALQSAKVHVFKVTPQDVPGLQGDVFVVKNEAPAVEFLVTLLGVPRDGTAYQIRTGFMAYSEEYSLLTFSKYKYDLPSLLGKKPQRRSAKTDPTEKLKD